MIFRRLTQHLREQNWAAIFIEFVLLVLGVFLGIQVANWNEARQERALEAEYIARLQRDFGAIDARLTINMTRWENTAFAPIRLINDLDAFRQLGTWPRAKAEMLRDLDATMGSRIPAPRAASYAELLSAGRLGLLRDRRLREALADYDTQAGFTLKAYDVLMQRADPQRSTLVKHLRFDRGAHPAQMNPDDILRNGGDPWADVDLVQLAVDPGLETALNTFANASYNHVLNVRLQQAKAHAVMALLEPDGKRTEAAPR
ncbi:MAG: hypothetical protein LKM32_08695 [Chiayiivirga sp.]|jgi:hypothetical protein|uniref:hypothetical protein n=1 Tax=Chiayiivirga sp. TaxID=2041042 RepID=UPI0025B8D485|nr:hypothetical protein [Chiayiivirga sp.]MCI1711972.1 hypothetical protein [Chiayiivirga sp.]MCI1729431.1 hypothetical protein [Chiayiivirga sp.]